MKKNSYISKLFTILSILLIIVSILMSISIYNYSQTIIRDEISGLNSAVLKQASDSVSNVIADSINLCNKLAYDSKLIEFLESNPDNINEKKAMSTYMANMISDYIWSQNSHKNLFEAYVIGYNGVNFTTYSSKYNITDVYDNPRYKMAFNGSREAVLVNTFLDPEESSVYRYAFQVVREIRDHITGKPCGFVIINISEKVLFDSFDDLINEDKKIVLVDQDGSVLSSKDKRLIGTKYASFNELHNSELKERGYESYKNSTGTYLMFYNRIQGTNWYILEEMQMNKAFAPLQSIKTFVLIITTVCVIIISFLSRYFANKTSEPVVSIRNKMEQVTRGDLSVRADVKNGDEFGQISQSFNEMVQQIEYLLSSVKEEERKKRLAELDFLRAQINPHFIYNTLSSIRFYVEMNKNEKAEEMIYHFSKILRKTLSRSNEFITIRDEINSIDNYVKLQKLRYSDGFEVTYDISEDILDCTIPTFILQPIVENSIFYSVGKDTPGLIGIYGSIEGDNIKFIVCDNGIGMSQKQIDETFKKENSVNNVGLINVHERLQLNYGIEYGLKLISKHGEGTRVILTLPVQKNLG